ncbi:MAG: hypothetical protein PF508_13165 [Spirochaeta sp.]|jgi:hypothetical protein|nr:hypothetical protein [Spirochaeta sp.]
MKSSKLPAILFFAILLPVFFLMWGCTTPIEQSPDWITGVSADDPDGHRFVAYGRGTERAEAEGAAQTDAVRQIEQIIVRRLERDNRVLGETTISGIEDVAERRVEALEAEDTYTRIDARGSYEYYELLLYREIDLSSDLGLLDRPDELRPAGETLTSTRDGAFTAIRETLDREVPATVDERRQVLRDALLLASEIAVSSQPGDLSVALGQPLTASIRVTVTDSDRDVSVERQDFAVRTVGPLIDGVRGDTGREATTDTDGSFSVAVPTPRFAGTTTVTAEPTWLRSVVNRWEAELESDDTKDLLEAVAAQLRGQTRIRVTSQAAEIPTAVVVLDRDIAGNPMTGSDAMDGVLRELAARSFRVRRVDLSGPEREQLSSLERVDVADLYDLLPFEILSSVDRAIVGDARILEFNENEGFRVRVELDVVVFDLRRDERLARVTVTERISGSSAQATIRAAFQEAGRRLARQLAPQLP